MPSTSSRGSRRWVPNTTTEIAEKPDPAAWGLPDVPLVPLAGGARNRVLRAGRVVFKSTRRTEAQVAWLGHLRAPAAMAGLIVALPRPARSGRHIEDGWTCEPFIGSSRAPGEPDMQRLRSVMSRFHRMTAPVPQRPGFASARALLQEDRGGDIDLGSMPRDAVDLCRTAWRALPEGPHSALHADLNPSNVGVTAAGRFALWDWEEARRDLPGFDHAALGHATPAMRRAALAFEIASCWHVEPDRARTLLIALGRHGSQTGDSHPEDRAS